MTFLANTLVSTLLPSSTFDPILLSCLFPQWYDDTAHLHGCLLAFTLWSPTTSLGTLSSTSGRSYALFLFYSGSFLPFITLSCLLHPLTSSLLSFLHRLLPFSRLRSSQTTNLPFVGRRAAPLPAAARAKLGGAPRRPHWAVKAVWLFEPEAHHVLSMIADITSSNKDMRDKGVACAWGM